MLPLRRTLQRSVHYGAFLQLHLVIIPITGSLQKVELKQQTYLALTAPG